MVGRGAGAWDATSHLNDRLHTRALSGLHVWPMDCVERGCRDPAAHGATQRAERSAVTPQMQMSRLQVQIICHREFNRDASPLRSSNQVSSTSRMVRHATQLDAMTSVSGSQGKKKAPGRGHQICNTWPDSCLPDPLVDGAIATMANPAELRNFVCE